MPAQRRSGSNDPASDRWPLLLFGVFVVFAAALGISPWYRQDWLLENLLVVVALSLFAWTHRRRRFTNTSYTLLFVFLCLHEIGSHYTYSEVPYRAWLAGLTDLTGAPVDALGATARNHYDRLIHFAYGLLLTRLAVELFRWVARPTGWWAYLLPVTFILSHSAIYELIEWAAALVFGGELGTAYLGTQGDEWDSQKDMACAASGAVLAVIIMSATGFLRGANGAVRPPLRA